MNNIISLNSKENDIVAAPEFYNSSLSLMDDLQAKIKIKINELRNFNIEGIGQIEADIECYDYIFAVVFGIIGATVSSSDFIKAKFDSVHTDASRENPNTLLGKLLNYYGDEMDIPSYWKFERMGSLFSERKRLNTVLPDLIE